jgi:Tfp pilus assembly protein PilF
MVRNQASAASISDAGAVRGRAAHDENADVVVSGTRLQRGDAVGAVASRDRAGAQMPKPALGLLDRGLARARAGDNAGALADLDQAVRLAPRSARVHQERGRVLRALGEERRAKAEFARAAELDPALGDGDN